MARAFGALMVGIAGGVVGLFLGTTISCSFSSESMCGLAGVVIGAPVGFVLGFVAFLNYWKRHGRAPDRAVVDGLQDSDRGSTRTARVAEIPISGDRRSEAECVIAISIKVAPLAAALGVLGVGFFFSTQALIASGLIFVSGILAFGGLLISWRYYRPGVSLNLWFLVSAGLVLILVGALILPAVRVGELHLLGALLAVAGWFPAGVAGPVALLRSRIRSWLQT